MPSNHEIFSAIMFLYEEWTAQPDLSFPEILTDIKNRYIDQPSEPSDGWEPVKRWLSQAMTHYDFPEAQLKRDFQGTEYWDEGYRFEVEPQGLQLVYVGGLDLSETAAQRCKYRQEVCNDLIRQLYKAATGHPYSHG